jgi:hypothetical protein
VDRKKKILLADDVELFLELEKTLFRREHFDLLTARNGRQALEIIATERPDLVFMDFYMPVMNGDECATGSKATLCPFDADCHGDARRAGGTWQVPANPLRRILLKPINHLFVDTARRFLAVAAREWAGQGRGSRFFGPGRRQLLCNYSVNISTGGSTRDGRSVAVDTHSTWSSPCQAGNLRPLRRPGGLGQSPGASASGLTAGIRSSSLTSNSTICMPSAISSSRKVFPPPGDPFSPVSGARQGLRCRGPFSLSRFDLSQLPGAARLIKF